MSDRGNCQLTRMMSLLDACRKVLCSCSSCRSEVVLCEKTSVSSTYSCSSRGKPVGSVTRLFASAPEDPLEEDAEMVVAIDALGSWSAEAAWNLGSSGRMPLFDDADGL